MARTVVLALLLLPVLSSAQSIYRTTDAEGNVIFTDAPAADGGSAEEVGLKRTNTAPPPPDVPAVNRESNEQTPEPEKAGYDVIITNPPNETTIPMGPGNFSVSARIYPALRKYESLQLFLDGEPRGEPQASVIWDLTNVFRGAHDITVGVLDRDGKTLATSPTVRVYVQRPSVHFRND